MKIKSPWTDEQVAALNRWQRGFMHGFTCPNDHPNITTVALFAHRSGWICPLCDYRQDWAHDFMFEEQTNPLRNKT